MIEMTFSTYEDWEKSVHHRVQAEPTWAFLGYRKALFLFDLTWLDCDNIDEGHARGYGKQRDWFFKVALGSARESKSWYWKSHQLLPVEVLDHRLALVDEIISLIVTELSYQKNFTRTKSLNLILC